MQYIVVYDHMQYNPLILYCIYCIFSFIIYLYLFISILSILFFISYISLFLYIIFILFITFTSPIHFFLHSINIFNSLFNYLIPSFIIFYITFNPFYNSPSFHFLIIPFMHNLCLFLHSSFLHINGFNTHLLSIHINTASYPSSHKYFYIILYFRS